MDPLLPLSRDQEHYKYVDKRVRTYPLKVEELGRRDSALPHTFHQAGKAAARSQPVNLVTSHN